MANDDGLDLSIFDESNPPHPLLENKLSNSTVSSLEEMRNTDRQAHNIARRHLYIQGYNELLRDIMSGKRLRSLEILDDGRKISIQVDTRSGYVRGTEWSLDKANEIVPGTAYQNIPAKVVGILKDLDIGQPKDPETTQWPADHAAREVQARALMPSKERTSTISQYNQRLNNKLRGRIVTDIRVEKDGLTLTLQTEEAGRISKHTWTIERDGRLF